MINAAVIGCGNIGSLYDEDTSRISISSHAGAYSANPEIKLVSGCDIDEDKLQKFKKRWNVKSVYTDYKEMFREKDIDLLSICTYQNSHFEIIKEAVNTGIKNIICEKPIASNLSEALNIIDICKNKEVSLCVNISRRWDAALNNCINYIKTGGIGEIKKVHIYYTRGIYNTGSHIFDMIRNMFGEVKWVNTISKYSKCGIEETTEEKINGPTVDVQLCMNNNIDIIMQGLDYKNYLLFEIDILGTSGRIKIINSGRDYTVYESDMHDMFGGFKGLKQVNINFGPGLDDLMMNMVNNMVSHIKFGEEIKCKAEDGYKALEISQAIYNSLCTGKKVILSR